LFQKYLLFQKNLSYLMHQQVRLGRLLRLDRKYLLFQKNLSYLVLQLDQEDR
jgi:hypothetical protein